MKELCFLLLTGLIEGVYPLQEFVQWHGFGDAVALTQIASVVFGLGAAIPLVAVAYASRSGFMRVRDWVLTRIERVRYGFALLLGAMGVAILSGGDKWLEARALQWLPDAWVNFTVGI